MRRRADSEPLPTERAQVHILLAHFARFASPDGFTFTRELAHMADAAERQGRHQLAAAAREVLAEWEQRTGP